MRQQILGRLVNGALVQVALVAAVIVAPSSVSTAHTDSSPPVRLFRLEGTFSEELATKISSDDKPEGPGFTLTGARLEADSLGALTRIRTILTIANDDRARRITEVEWRLDVFDASLGSASTRLVQTDKINIYAGETGVASNKFAAVLPDRMIVLLQLVRVAFADGPGWSTTADCSLGKDLRTVSCQSK